MPSCNDPHSEVVRRQRKLGENVKKAKYTVKPGKLICQIFLIAFGLIQLFPLLWLLTFSLKTNAELFGDNILGLPKVFMWSNYVKAFSGSNLFLYFKNSILVTAITIVLTDIISLMASFALVRMKWKLSKLSYVFILLGLMIPVHAVLLPLFLTLNGIMNTLPALIIPYVAFSMPLAILILTGFMQGIPREMEEAAFIDGASIYSVFIRIILPLSKSVIATISILTYLSSWNELMFSITFINDDKLKTLPFGIMSMVGRYTTSWGPIGAALVLATIPTIIIYLFMSDKIEKSLAAGAVKG